MKLVAAAVVFVLFSSVALAYDVSLLTDRYSYSVNQSIYTIGLVKQNTTPVSNVSVVFQAKNTAGTVVNFSTLTSNATGQFNYSFSLSSAGNYTLFANASGDTVSHFIKVGTYAYVLTSTDKPTYTAGANGTLAIKAVDSSRNGIASQVVANNMRYGSNNSLLSNLSSCTTNALGECSVNFTAPSTDGQYFIESNNFESVVFFVVGGFDATMKISPSVLGLNSEVTIKVTVKNANGNGVSASTRQLLLTFPNNTEYTITSMTQAVDSSGNSLTGSYEDRYNVTGEGVYKVKATVVAQGSNATRELTGSFEVRGYVMDIVPWSGQSVFYPSSSVALGVKLKNASSNEFISGKTSAILTGISVLDPSDQALVVNVSVSEFTALSSYRVDFVLPSTATTGTYKLKVFINDSLGTGLGVGYFSVQVVRASAVTLDKFPNGTSKTNYLSGQQVVVKFTARNASGTISVTGVKAYSVRDENGNDKTALFGAIANYTSGGAGYLNMTAPKVGGDFRIKARLTTLAGDADAEGPIFVDVLDITARTVSIGGAAGGGFTPFGGPGFMFAFRPNDTIKMSVTVKSASEKQEGEGFMGTFAKGGSGPSVGGGLFGIGGGTAVQGAQVKVEKIININTDEDMTSSVTGTLTCVTDSSGACNVSMQPTTNGNNWTGGFYIVFMNASTSDNQTDSGEGFFEVRRYFLDVRINSVVQDNATALGFQSFQSWNIGPNDNVNVTVQIREPGTWNAVSNLFNVTVLGFFYGGKIGDFIFPPKLITGTNKTYNDTGATSSTIINAPSGGWKSGFYQVKVSISSSGQVDTGEGFIMSRIYEGFGFPVNPTTLQQDFTARSSENITLRVSVYDVQKHGPAANLTVTKNKILSFASFPPSELSYEQNVTQGTTDANGVVLMTLSAPAGGWPKGSFLAVFDVTNGSVSDNVEGFFQVKNFFAELTTSKWQFATNESVAYNVTISSDPSWMRNAFGGCPPGDPGCSGGGPPSSGGGGGGGGGSFAEPSSLVVNYNTPTSIDGDNIPDVVVVANSDSTINLTLAGNLTLGPGGELSTRNLSISRTLWCSGSGCASGAASAPFWFESVSCAGQLNQSDFNYRNITVNFTGPAIVCVQTSKNLTYKVGAGGGSGSNYTLQFIQEVAGSVGGSTGLSVSSNSGISYFNASLKSIRVARIDFSAGTTVLTHGTDYNVTSANGVLVGAGNIMIPGSGGIKLKPFGQWTSGFYHVQAEFNTSDGSESAESGFLIETYSTSCFRQSWSALSSNDVLLVTCTVSNPGGGNYPNGVDVTVESVKNAFSRADMSSALWASSGNFTNVTRPTVAVTINQSLPTGSYEATIKFNQTTDIKRYSIWFDVKDFEPQFYSTKWSYSTLDNITFIARGTSGATTFRLNLSNETPTVYRYDPATWTRSSVSGVTARGFVDSNLSYNINVTVINLSRSSAWDEGQYQVILNITRINGMNAAQGNPVEVQAWFSVRLFDVYGYATQWSFHPKSNVTMRIFVGDPSSFNARYTSNVTVNVTDVRSTATGAVLTKGTDYNPVGNKTVPSVTGDVLVSITPVSGGSLPSGSYKTKVTVTDSVSGGTMTTDVYFTVVAYYLSAYADKYEVGAGENATIILNAYSPTTGTLTLSDAVVSSMQFCNANYTCTSKALASFNYTFNAAQSKLSINTSGFGEGWYTVNLVANDTQNINQTGSAYFRVKSFAMSGFIEPVSGSSRSGYGYQINETMRLNVTGSLGINITNATFTYYDCTSSGCTSKSFLVQIGYNMTSTNVVLNLTPANITPAVLNNTWPVSEYAFYSIEVRGVKSGTVSSFFTYTNVYFPRASVSGPSSVSTSSAIAANITAYVESLTGQSLAGANITVTDVLQDSGFSLTPISSGKWNVSSKIANSSGVAELVAQLNGTTWPSGNLRVRYSVVYGNASTKAEFTTSTSSPSLGVSKFISNATTGASLTTATLGTIFNLTLILQNTQATNATNTSVVVTLPLLSNGTAATNLTTLLRLANITDNSVSTLNWQFNTSGGRGNYTTQISVTPPSPFTSISTSHTFAVG